MGPGGAVWGKKPSTKKSHETVPLRHEHIRKNEWIFLPTI